MSDSIAKAYVQIVPSAKGIQGSLGKALGGEMPAAGKSAGKSLGGSLIGTVKGLIATAGIGAAFGKAISEGAAMEQSLGGVETLFKDSADKVIANARQAYKTAGMSANEYMELTTSFSASLLQSVAGDTSEAADIADMAMRDMSDNANKMGTDLDRITDAYQGFAKQNYTMLDNLKLGYGGTKGEMQRLLADAQKLTGVEHNLDNLNDVYSAIHVIQGELDITGTTAKEAASTISGSASSMKAAFSDLLANIALGAPIEDSLTALTESVFTFAGNLLPAIGNVLAGLPAVLQTALSAAIQGLNMAANNADAIVQQGLDLVLGLGSAIVEAAPYLAEAAFNLISSIGSTLMSMDWVEIIGTTVANMRNSLDLAAGEILGTDGNIVQSIITAIGDGLPGMLETGTEIINSLVTGIFDNLPALVDSALETLTSFINMLIEHLPDVLESGKSILLNIVEGIRTSLPDIVASAAEAVASLISGLVEHLPDIIAAGFDLIVSLITGIGDAIPDIITAAGEIASNLWETIKDIDWWELGTNIIQGLIDGIGAMGSVLWDAARNIAWSALDAIKGFFGIHSPSTVMRDQVGKFLPAGVAVGIEANTKPVQDAMHHLAGMSTATLKADLAPNRLSLPAAASASPESVVINVYGAAGQDVSALADIVMQRLQLATEQRGGAFA